MAVPLVLSADGNLQQLQTGQTLEKVPIGFSLKETTPTAKTYSLIAPMAFTVLSLLRLKTSSGTLTLTVQIEGVDVGGLTSLAVSSTVANPTATGANVVAAGDTISIIVSSVSSASDLQFALSGMT